MDDGSNERRAPAGTLLRAGGKDGPQLIESSGKRWTEAAERRFLDALGASCNVKRSAAAAGFSTVAIYKRRAHDAAFAERWQLALEQGYVRIEMLLVQRATDALEGYFPDPDMPIPEMSVRDALAILAQHRASVRGEGKRPGWRPRPRSLDEVRDSILTKLEAIETKRLALLAAPASSAGPTEA